MGTRKELFRLGDTNYTLQMGLGFTYLEGIFSCVERVGFSMGEGHGIELIRQRKCKATCMQLVINGGESVHYSMCKSV